MEQTSRRLKFQELLLLLLRMAVLILLALALARPYSKEAMVGDGSSRSDAVDAVFVIDNSYSMATEDDKVKTETWKEIVGEKEWTGIVPVHEEGDKKGQPRNSLSPITRLGRAKLAALAVLKQLPPYSTVRVVSVSNQATLLPETGVANPADFDRVAEIVSGLEIAHRSTDFLPAIRMAARIFDKEGAPNKALYLFSDMHTLGWQRQSEAVRTELKAIGEKYPVILVHSHSQEPKNASIVGLTPQQAFSIVHTNVADEQTAFNVLVRNSGKHPVEGLTVSLSTVTWDEKGEAWEKDQSVVPVLNAKGEQVLEPSPEPRNILLTAKLEKPGLTVVRAELRSADDKLNIDDRYERVFHVHDRIRILTIDGVSPEKRRYDADPIKNRAPEGSSYYIALQGLDADVEKVGLSPFAFEDPGVPPELVDGRALEDKEMCILANVPVAPDGNSLNGLRPEFVARLREFVKSGKPLVIFLGDACVPDAYNQALADLLPARLTREFDYGERPDPMSLPYALAFDNDSAAGFLVPLKKEVILSLVGYHKAMGVEDPAAAKAATPGVQVLCRFHSIVNEKTGRPAVLSRKVDKGNVILVTTCMDKSWGRTGTSGPLILLMKQLMLQLPSHADAGHNSTMGQPLTWHPRTVNELHPEPAVLITPSPRATEKGPTGVRKELEGKKLDVGPARRPGEDAEWTVSTDQTSSKGLYRLALKRETARDSSDRDRLLEEKGIPFVVNLEPAAGTLHGLLESDSLESMTPQDLDAFLGFKPKHLKATEEISTFRDEARFNRDWTFWFLVAVLGLVLMEVPLAWFCGRSW
jgi:hypothetical protein